MFQQLKDWLALTATERKVILFLTVTFLIGAGIRLYQETFPSTKQFDYRTSDSTYAALNESIDKEQLQGDSLSTGIVNINKASKEQLMSLPNIGEVTAERILLYRDEAGSFKNIDDLKNIKGITKKKFEQLKPFVTVK
ncbi:MAG: helix-hairpin-helix domain-containing protein [Ignavibacteriales bacterium]|nr:helix-hairpin-helix domain-containing protein [Ignavibacteriales bacterium]